MAKFGAAYGLCPLIDHRSLLGVTVDSDENCVIVTIGKNIVSSYKFQDQKQVSSWSTKDKLTSSVVYDRNSLQYIAIFNHNQLRLWKCDDQLDKVKKYKFQKPLHGIITDGEDDLPLVLFRDGYVLPLPEALESRKNVQHKTIIGENNTILEYNLIRCNGLKYVVFISSNDKDMLVLNVLSVATKQLSLQQEIKRPKDNVFLVGHVMSDSSSPSLFTLWSDGSLFSYPCLSDASENFPGVLQQKVVSVNTKHPVALSCISNRHIVLFGADPSEEGAILVLLNLQYQVIQSRLHFKLYSTPPRLWNVNNHLLVAMGCNLIAVPYNLEAEHLSSLVGTTCMPSLMCKTTWLNTKVVTPKPKIKTAPATMKWKVQKLRNEGVSLGAIIQNILPELIEMKDTESLLWTMNNFSDIPENCLVQILNFCLSEPDSTFTVDNSQTISHHKKWVSSQNGRASGGDDEKVLNMSTPLKPKGRVLLVDRALNIPFSDVCLMPHLRSIPFAIIVALLTHLCHLMDHEDTVDKSRVIDWISLLVDSHYQEYLLCRDENIMNLISKINALIYSELSILHELDKLFPVLRKINARQIPLKVPHYNMMYSIETLRLY